MKKMQEKTKRGRPGSPAKRFHWIGNGLCVDFANTLRSADTGEEALRSWRDLTDFLEAAGACRREEIARLRGLRSGQPKRCATILSKAHLLRCALRRIFAAMDTKKEIAAAWIAEVNEALKAGEGFQRLSPRGRAWQMEFVGRHTGPKSALVEIARSAAQVIAEGKAAQVRKCGSPKCVLYFYDTSRTGRRRWCSMAVCGNRSKVAAFDKRK